MQFSIFHQFFKKNPIFHLELQVEGAGAGLQGHQQREGRGLVGREEVGGLEGTQPDVAEPQGEEDYGDEQPVGLL